MRASSQPLGSRRPLAATSFAPRPRSSSFPRFRSFPSGKAAQTRHCARTGRGRQRDERARGHALS
jgi:hypothetical protein